MAPSPSLERIYESTTRHVLYGVLGHDGLTQGQLDKLDANFCCGLILDDPIEYTDWKRCFRMLVAAGCRAICLWSKTDVSLEEIFDDVAIESGLEGDDSVASVLWSTTHNDLEDMLRFTLLTDLSEAYANNVGSVILLQYGAIDRREFCRAALKSIDEQESD